MGHGDFGGMQQIRETGERLLEVLDEDRVDLLVDRDRGRGVRHIDQSGRPGTDLGDDLPHLLGDVDQLRRAGEVFLHQVEQVGAARDELGAGMTGHGRRGLRRALLGSDAEEVVRNASVPVLLVRDRTLDHPRR